MFTSYSQADPRWSGVTLGTTSLTVGRYGCIVTALASLSTYFQPGHDPGFMAKFLRFTPDGLLYWNSAKFETWGFTSRILRRDDGIVRRHILTPGLAVILRVQGGRHWVLAVSAPRTSATFGVSDPIDGKIKSLNAYGADYSGFATFARYAKV